MRRFVWWASLLVLFFLAFLAVFVVVPQPAHAAEWYDSDIIYYNRGPSGHTDDGKVRLAVWYNTQNDGDGYTIKRVRIDCWPDFAFNAEGNKVDGISLSIQNENNVVFFESNSIDLGQDCEKNWYPDVTRNGSLMFHARYYHHARLSGRPDAYGTNKINCPCRPV